MRPSKLRTPLARLRNTITLKFKGKPVRLSQQDVADWCGLSCYMIRDIEAGTQRLQPEHAVKIALKTGCSLDWLLGNAAHSREPLNKFLRPYSQVDFDNAQRQRTPSRNLVDADFRILCGMVAASLLRGLERGDFDTRSALLKHHLRSAYFDKGEPASAWNPVVATAAFGGLPELLRAFAAIQAGWRRAKAQQLKRGQAQPHSRAAQGARRTKRRRRRV